MTTWEYEATFADGKIGRHRNVQPLKAYIEEVPSLRTAEVGDRFAKRVHRYARQYLASRDVEVEVLEDGTGTVCAGFRTVASFTWKRHEHATKGCLACSYAGEIADQDATTTTDKEPAEATS